MKRPVYALSFVMAVATACSVAEEPSQPTGPTRLGAALGERHSPRPFTGMMLDDMLAKVDELSPGFAGMYGAPGDSLIIAHSGSASLASVLEAMRAVMGDGSPEYRVRGARLVSVRFGFRELANYRSQIESRGFAGWVTSDIDEVNNRVLIGVESDEIASRVRSTALALDIPPEAVLVRTEARPRPATSLRSRLDTTKAGISVAILTGQGYGGGNCSIGFNYTLWSSTNYFMTNGHCTYNYAGNGILDTTVKATQNYYASFPFPFPDEAREVANPSYRVLSGCPSSSCRYSDAVGFRWQTSQVIGQGKLAMTSWDSYGQSQGDTIIAGTFNITAESPSGWLYPHALPSKMGATTGFTSGEILQSCMTFYDIGGQLLCQFRSELYIQPGDSGGPVFFYSNTTNESSVTLAGIVHHFSDVTPFPWTPQQFPPAGGTIFSSIGGIQADFGALRTYPTKP